MLGFPFIADFIQRVKPLEVTDSVDFMNYYCTTLLLAMAAFAISAKQYFGSPIQCWVPMEFRGGWEKYTEDYCFIQNSYYVSMEEEIPNELHKRNDQISYYRWVPVVQMLQALMFFAPNYFWNACCKQTAIQPQAIVKDAKKISMLRGENRKDEVCGLAEYISETVSIFSGRRFTRLPFPRLGKNATVLYLLTKLFYVMNIVAQFFLLNHFLEENFLLWGFQVLGDVISRREWQESSVFPRVIMCDFEVRRLANIHRHSVQCVIMLNMINEKFYFFLWFWFLIVGFCTIVNFFYHLIVMTVPRARMRLVLWNIRKIEWETDTFGKENMKCFINNFLRCDGVLLLKFITEHADARICRELTIELIKLYAQKWQTNFAIRNNRLRETGAPEQMYSGRSPANLPGYYESNIQRFNGVCKRNFAPAPAQMGAVQYNKCNGQKPTLDDVDRSETLPIAPKARGQSSGEQNSLQNGGTSIEKAQVHSSSTQDHESDASSSGMQYQQQPKPKDA